MVPNAAGNVLVLGYIFLEVRGYSAACDARR